MGQMQIRSELTNGRARLSDNINRDHAHTAQATYDVKLDRLFHRLHVQRSIPSNNALCIKMIPIPTNSVNQSINTTIY